jgi:hypothetical protein
MNTTSRQINSITKPSSVSAYCREYPHPFANMDGTGSTTKMTGQHSAFSPTSRASIHPSFARRMLLLAGEEKRQDNDND